MKEFIIKAYAWKELALLYCPGIEPASATRRLRDWVFRNEPLVEELKDLGWKKGVRILTPRQVKVLVSYLGPP